MEPYYNENGYFEAEIEEKEPLPTYMAKTFGWMCLGLLTTFAVAIAMCAGYINFMLPSFFYSGAFPFIILIAEVVVVIALSARMQKMSPNAVRVMFFLYAALNGVTFSVIFLAYNVMTLVLVFGMTMLYFGGMALYGYLTKTDLTKFGPLLFGGVLVLGVFWLLSMFLNLSGMETIMCIIGVVIFM
ncbi:MAG: Bax inhibitor-1/YccA family protein, partial [Oscillospiraceae bacterium]|nr:Bax inhibitor-1/YccA family protein [Oscillospiraceae bacterium]